jgi:CheY-like chemotaxis protein
VEKRILIIDDEQKNIFALNAVLKSRKYSCITAASALEGISILRAEPDIGIVLMDMMMPDMDGYEAIRIIRADKTICSVPVIAVTAQAMKGDREKCLEAGANGYISKPVDVDALLELITQAHQKGGR